MGSNLLGLEFPIDVSTSDRDALLFFRGFLSSFYALVFADPLSYSSDGCFFPDSSPPGSCLPFKLVIRKGSPRRD